MMYKVYVYVYWYEWAAAAARATTAAAEQQPINNKFHSISMKSHSCSTFREETTIQEVTKTDEKTQTGELLCYRRRKTKMATICFYIPVSETFHA